MSGWDYFSEEERNATDKNLTKLCKPTIRGGHARRGPRLLGALRIVSCGGARLPRRPMRSRFLRAPLRPDGPSSRLADGCERHWCARLGRSTACASVVGQLNAEYLKASSAMDAAVSVGTPVGEKISTVLSQGKAVITSYTPSFCMRRWAARAVHS